MKDKIKLTCNECGRKFSVSPNAADPRCPKCGGVDWDVAEPISSESAEINRISKYAAQRGISGHQAEKELREGDPLASMPGYREWTR